MSTIFGVSELTQSIKDLLESEFPFVWVKGEVSGVGRPASGHLYFALTDGRALVNVVWFKGSQEQVEVRGADAVHPLTGEVMDDADRAKSASAATLADGDEVLVAGRINVYEPRGQYQLVAELVQFTGAGDLLAAFEALKRELAAEGYFDESRKMRPPRHPGRVALVTSHTGAAVRDFLRIAGRRGHGAAIHIYPTAVQGAGAPQGIADAIDRAVDDGWAEVVVVARGGGSLEDLAAFNTRRVADAVYRCPLPVISGVGHEPDVTIIDLAADVRAATPSHAAQLLWPEREALMQRVDETLLRLASAFAHGLAHHERELGHAERALRMQSPTRRLERIQGRLEDAARRLQHSRYTAANRCAQRLDAAMRELARALAPARLRAADERVLALRELLTRAINARADAKAARLDLLTAKVRALDPESPLGRGYSLVTVERTGRFLRSAADAAPGDALTIRARDGSIHASVTGVHPDGEE